MKTHDPAGWLLPSLVVLTCVPVALGQLFGIAVDPDQSALASFAATLATLVLVSALNDRRPGRRPSARVAEPTHGSVHHRR